MDKILIAIGGGEIKNKTTLKIDNYIANLAKAHAGDKRATALFVGTASHDSMPYFNSFRKTYTSNFDLKAEVALMVYGENDMTRIKEKVEKADMIYVGGGDTIYMLDLWKKNGFLDLILDAYRSGKIICGLSAGAICWFEDMYSDFEIMRGVSSNYVMHKGLGEIEGAICPHFNEREEDFITAFNESKLTTAYALENDSALVFINGKLDRSLSSGGKAYFLNKEENKVIKREI